MRKMKYKSYLLFIPICGFLISACSRKTSTLASAKRDTKKDYTVENVIQSVNAKSVQVKYIQAKGQVSLDGSGFFSSGSLNLRIAKDSLIWFSVSKLGIEITRGIITADSAFALNNWENTYWKGSLDDISNQYQVPADFNDIQSIILPSLNPQSEYLMSAHAHGVTMQQQGTIIKKYTIDASSYLIHSISVSHANSDLKVNYADYAVKENFVFPLTHTHYTRSANAIHETKIKFSSIGIVDKINTPFYIPSDFDQIK